MCNTSNAIIVEEVVDEFITQGKMFTAWDVTKVAKQRGADEPHRFLKGAVHGMFADGTLPNSGYSRSIINVGSPPPWVYHPVNADPQDYEDEILNGQGSSSPTDGVQTAVNHTVTVTAASASCFKRDVDKDGRLCIPKPLLLELNLTAGEMVDVFVNHTDIEVCPHDGNLQPDAVFSVNKDGRIRLGPALMGTSKRSRTIEIRKNDTGIDRIVVK